MTIANTNVKSVYNGNGVTRDWNLGFHYDSTLSSFSIVVTHEDGTSETVTANYELDGNVLTYPTVESELDPLPVGDVLTISRITPLTQNINLVQQGPLDAETLESGYDKLTMEVQEVKQTVSENILNINTVAENIDNVNTVATNISNVNAVVSNATNINTVASDIANVNAVGSNIENVNAVNDNSANINAVVSNSTNINTVASISSDVTNLASISNAIQAVDANESNINLVASNLVNVNTVASNMNSVLTTAADIANINTVASDTTNIDAVAGNATNINTVANKISNVNTVASNISDVNTVAANISDISNVNDNLTIIEEVSENMDDVIAAADAVEEVLPHITEINNVSDNISDVVTVAGINADVSAVASNSSNINTVSGNSTNINTVATNISNINAVAADLTNIDNASTYANNAANSATNAATSATNAQKWAEGTDADVQPLGGTKSSKGWANRAQELVESIGTVMRYKGSVADYAALQAIQNPTLGDTYNVLDTGANYSWDGSAWDEIGSAVDLSAYRTSADQDVIDATKAPNTNKVNGIPLSTQNAYYYAESTSAADAVEKTVSIPAITELNAGQVIIVKPTITSTVANSTLKLNSFTAYPMLYGGSNITTSTDSKVWSAYIPSIFVFDGSYWRFAGHGADDNTTYSINYMIYAGTANAGTGTYAVSRYGLLMQKLDGTWETLKDTSTNYTTATTKTVNTHGFLPGKIVFYNTTTVRATGQAITVSYMYLKYTTVDARYSFNCGATPGWSAGDSIYIVGTIGSDGLFYLDTTTWWSNALPTTKDGKVYMYLGTYVSDAYKITLDLDHPMYYHDGTSVKQYVVAGNKADLDPSTGKLSSTQVPSLSGTYVDLATADQQITAQKIVRNNWITNALYILANISGWTWYKALSWTGSRIRVGDSSNVGLQLETNESTIKAKIGANTYDVLTTADNVGGGRNVGEIVESTVPLTDAGLHLLDGSLLSGSGSYADFVTHMAGVYTDHPELFTTEANWQTSVTNYGVCGKFVYDSVNNTVRLPKKSSTERHLVKSTVSGESWCDVYSDGWCEQGDKIGLGSNQGYKSFDITFQREMANSHYNIQINSDFTGSTSDGTNYYSNPTTTGVTIRTCGYGYVWSIAGYTDVSDLGQETIYQYIVIANSTKTEIEVDIDEIATDLNGKADVDLSNVSNTSGFRKLIEVYNNGTSWCKVYNEYDPSTGTFIGKWCEQGGRTTYSTTGTETVSLLKEMRDTNYSCQVTLFGDTSGYTSNIQGQYLTCWDLTTTSFKHQRFNAQTVQQMWKVCGYLA